VINRYSSNNIYILPAEEIWKDAFIKWFTQKMMTDKNILWYKVRFYYVNTVINETSYGKVEVILLLVRIFAVVNYAEILQLIVRTILVVISNFIRGDF